MLDLAAVLSETLVLVRASQHEGWAQRRPTEQIARWLEEMILDAREVAGVDRSAIGVAFAPTGELQELAMANGWSDEYMSLSAQVDVLLRDA